MIVKKGWTLVGLFLSVVGFALCQPINLSVYAQPAENTTTDSDPFLFGSPSNSPQNQIPSAQDSLASTPGPSSLDLDPTTDQESPGAGGEAPNQQKVSPDPQFPSNSGPDPTTSSENIVNEQVQNNGDASENTIFQSPALQSQETGNRPGVSEQPNQNRADDDENNNDNNQENTPDSDKQDQQAIGDVNENSDENENENSDSRNDNEENDEEEEEDNEESSDSDSDSDNIPLEYDIVPFP